MKKAALISLCLIIGGCAGSNGTQAPPVTYKGHYEQCRTMGGDIPSCHNYAQYVCLNNPCVTGGR